MQPGPNRSWTGPGRWCHPGGKRLSSRRLPPRANCLRAENANGPNPGPRGRFRRVWHAAAGGGRARRSPGRSRYWHRGRRRIWPSMRSCMLAGAASTLDLAEPGAAADRFRTWSPPATPSCPTNARRSGQTKPPRANPDVVLTQVVESDIELLAAARSGLLALTGHPGRSPRLPGGHVIFAASGSLMLPWQPLWRSFNAKRMVAVSWSECRCARRSNRSSSRR